VPLQDMPGRVPARRIRPLTRLGPLARIRRLAVALAGLSAFAATALLASGATPASAATSAPQVIAPAQPGSPGVPAVRRAVKIGGRHCVKVTSQNNFGATICMEIRSQQHGRGETIWPEATFTVTTGGILEDFAGDLFFRECNGFTGSCSNGDVSANVDRFPRHPRSVTIIGKAVDPTPGVPISYRAEGTELCVDWDTFQAACRPATLKAAP
jgi:hypothetical protein